MLVDLREGREFQARSGDIVFCACKAFQHAGILVEDCLLKLNSKATIVEKVCAIQESYWGPTSDYTVELVGRHSKADPVASQEIADFSLSWVDRFITILDGPLATWGLAKPKITDDAIMPPVSMSCATFVEAVFERHNLDLVNDGDSCCHLPLWPDSSLAGNDSTDPDSWKSRAPARRLFPGYQAHALRTDDYTWTPTDFTQAIIPRAVPGAPTSSEQSIAAQGQ